MAAASPTPDVPLEIEPLVGWRVWKLGRNSHGELRLRAIVHSHEWAPQTVEPAVCAARPYRTASTMRRRRRACAATTRPTP